MNLIKSREFFNPQELKERIHIIGCGSVGSTIAELLARFGITKISLYDFDIVAPHNLANQMFFERDIKRLKVDAVKDLITSINHEANNDIETFEKGYVPSSKLNGYVFLCVDNIDLRREIATKNRFNQSIKAMFDVRTRLTDAQSFATEWVPQEIDNFLKSMDFTHEEAAKETPITACNVTMSVATTIRVICSLCVSNFVNYTRTKDLKKIITADTFSLESEAY